MTEEIRRGAIKAISDTFGLPVYGQAVPQGGKKPCFTVEIEEMEQKRLLGRRAARKISVGISYFCGEKKTAAAEGLAVTEGLYEALSIIGEKEKFAAGSMKHEKTADGVKVTAEYEYHVILEEEAGSLMERLAYNGKEAVGYEEAGNIQQRTALQE